MSERLAGDVERLTHLWPGLDAKRYQIVAEAHEWTWDFPRALMQERRYWERLAREHWLGATPQSFEGFVACHAWAGPPSPSGREPGVLHWAVAISRELGKLLPPMRSYQTKRGVRYRRMGRPKADAHGESQ
jgi:hypothetical protein